MRIVFSCVPSEGHFSPLLPLGRALAGRGHDVVFAVSKPWQARATEEGFDSFAAGPAAEEVHRQLDWSALAALPPPQRRPVQFSTLFGKLHAPAKLPALLEGARDRRADAILHDSGDLAAPLAAAVLELPVVNHSFGAMIPRAVLDPAAEAVAPLWRAQGLEPDPDAGAFRGLFVDLAPESFAWERPAGKVFRLRPVPGAAGPAPPWLAELGTPLVYATLGTVFNDPAILRTLLEGLEGPFSALLTTGRNVDPAELGTPPPRVRVERFVPQAHVLAAASVVVGHGGSGTTLGALAQGIPLVLVPIAADQFDNADRAEKAGAAIVLRPGEVTGAAVREAVGRALEDAGLAAGAGRIAAEIAEMGDADEAAAAVEEHVARG